jgi:hypothetical protein
MGRLRTLGTGLLVTAGLVLVEPALARKPRPVEVAVGQTYSADGNPVTAKALDRALRRAIEKDPNLELASHDRATHLVEGSITQLERKDEELDCKVSLYVTLARSGTLKLLLSGRKRVAGPMADGPRGQDFVIEGAVRGAVGGIPAAIEGAR